MTNNSNRKNKKIQSKRLKIKLKNKIKKRNKDIFDDSIEIIVSGFGYCRFKNNEEINQKLTWCKNGVWKYKGDKGVDQFGEELVSEDEDFQNNWVIL